MTIQTSLIITGSILIGLVLIKIILNLKHLYNDSILDQDIMRRIAIYALAILLSFGFGVVLSYRDCITEFFDSDIVDSLFFIGAFIITVFLLVKQTGDAGYAESLDDMSGAIIFISSVIPPITYLLLYSLSGAALYYKYRAIDERDNNYILSLLIKITVNAGEIVLCTLATTLMIERIFTFTFWEKLVYLAVLLLISEIFLPIINTYVTKRLYCNFQKSE